MPICENCGSYFARKELGCPNCKSKEQEKKYLDKLEDELKTSKDNLARIKDTYEQTINQIRQQNIDLQKQLKEENENINNLISDLASVEKEQDRIQAEIEHLTKSMAEIESESINAKNEKSELEAKFVSLS